MEQQNTKPGKKPEVQLINEEDSGPLFGFDDEASAPSEITPSSPGRYVLVDFFLSPFSS